MKKLLLIAVWLIFLDAGEKTEWYIEFYSDENTIHKVARDQYLEMIEFFELNEKKIDYKNYIKWECKDKFVEQKKINVLLIK